MQLDARWTLEDAEMKLLLAVLNSCHTAEQVCKNLVIGQYVGLQSMLCTHCSCERMHAHLAD